MAKNIRIGADEIILWLRKNNKATHISNRTLGKAILLLIERLGGSIDDRNFPSRWGTTAEHLGNMDLPRTSAQYTISTAQMERLYDELDSW
jgi:hypothetical protein